MATAELPRMLAQPALAEPATAQPDVAVGESANVALSGPWHVVLLNDDDHSYEYVMIMLVNLFGHSLEKAYRCAREVDTTGRAIVDTTSKERAELKRDQIHAFGPDRNIPRCAGSMSATIEPA